MIFEYINFNDYKLEKIQNNISKSFALINADFTNGLLISDIALTAVVTQVNHGLRKTPSGYIVLKRNAGAVVFNGSINENYIELSSTVNVTVDIWIF